MKKIIIIFFIVFKIGIGSDVAIISSFNVKHLGWKGKNIKKLAPIISLFDLVGLQEVMKESGLIKLRDELQNQTGEKWGYYITSESVGSSKYYQEYYAYIWKKDRVEMIRELGFFEEENESDFSREPYGADFRIGEFDFTYVLVHSIFGDKKTERQNEARLIDDVYMYFQKINGSEQDVLIGGDFNLPAYDEAFSQLFSLEDEIYYAIDPTNKTTIGHHGLASSYDNIFYSYKHTKEFTGNYGVYDFTVNNHKEIRKTVSDHLPVFIEVNIEKDDD
ncbi:MAG: endonuclease/exonuclease/phosphatase family protein [Fusobacteriota bacterium]